MQARIKAWWIVVAFLCGAVIAVAAEELRLRALENRLEFSAPQLHFLTGRPLERLQNAALVPFDIEVTLWTGSRNNIHSRQTATFVISYDLFEERYSVAKLSTPRRNTNHMTASEAEAWCLQEMSMDVTGVAANQPLWARMVIRAQDERGPGLFRGRVSEEGINITDLVELFGGRPRAAQARWELEAGPVTLEQLRRAK
jgi:hypothetical protein